jgi:NADP-dependent aldehyde dehydrogenase
VSSVDQGRDPRTGQAVGAPLPHTDPSELDRLAGAAASAAPALAALAPRRRGAILRAVATALDTARDELIGLADSETALGPVRLDGELTRTCVQLDFFADVLADGSFLDVVLDHAEPTALPAPRPDLRRMLVPIGPTAVFAASNFPFAFSVAGGDTASALAAGCPVVVKAHPGHPGLSAGCAQIVADALQAAGAPAGAFSIIRGLEAGRRLVTHPAITAAAFTGSLGAGRSLFDLAAGRPDPIPFYGELGSLNPTVVTAGALAQRSAEIVAGYIGSLTLGAGQFCTKPGLLFVPKGHDLDEALIAAADGVVLGPLLNDRVREGYTRSARAMAAAPGVRSVLRSTVDQPRGRAVAPVLLAVSAADLMRSPDVLLAECFGPAGLVVEYDSPQDLTAALAAVPGALSATLHADRDAEPELVRDLLGRMAALAGRVVWDGWPTGVAVTWAQHHGGPWPATTSPLHTSVGATAIRRFLRPVTYQNLPDDLLPEPLRDANPWRLPRRVNGRFHSGQDST